VLLWRKSILGEKGETRELRLWLLELCPSEEGVEGKKGERGAVRLGFLELRPFGLGEEGKELLLLSLKFSIAL